MMKFHFEVWKTVPSWPGMMASSWGRIKIEPYESPMPNGGVRKYETKPTYGHWNKVDKRYILARNENGKTKTYRVAPLVCEAFHGSCPEGLICLHRNENSRDNRPDNLKWGTQKENLNCPGFISYCRSRTGENNPHTKGKKRSYYNRGAT